MIKLLLFKKFFFVAFKLFSKLLCDKHVDLGAWRMKKEKKRSKHMYMLIRNVFSEINRRSHLMCMFGFFHFLWKKKHRSLLTFIDYVRIRYLEIERSSSSGAKN